MSSRKRPISITRAMQIARKYLGPTASLTIEGNADGVRVVKLGRSESAAVYAAGATIEAAIADLRALHASRGPL